MKMCHVVKLDQLCETATKVTLQHTQSSWPKVLESHKVFCWLSRAKVREREVLFGKGHGMRLRGRLARRWNGAVAEAGIHVSQHSVELKVQLLTGREGEQVGEVSGWLTESVPRTQTQNHSQKILWNPSTTYLVGSFVINRYQTTCRCKICFFTGTVYWGVMLPPSMLRAKGAAIFCSTPRRNLQ